MNHETSSLHSRSSSMSQMVERACRHWETRQAAARQRRLDLKAERAFTIALSREAGAHADAVGKELGKRLGWQIYDHALIEQIARDMGLQTRLLESVDEREQSWLLETAEAFLSAPRTGNWGPLVTESGYVRHLVKTVLALGVHGECVIVGRGAVFILPVESTLRVRLVAPLRDRIMALSRKFGISELEASRKVRGLDRARADFVRDHFANDPREHSHHDLVLNTSRLPPAECASVIIEGLRQMQTMAGREGEKPNPSEN